VAHAVVGLTLPSMSYVNGAVLAAGAATDPLGISNLALAPLAALAGSFGRARVVDGPQVWHQRPAVDLLFKSAADCGAGPYTVAGVLTGMGKDGAEGLLRLKEKGAITFAQDEASSIVYGMPRAAWENGGAQRQISLQQVADHIIRQFTASAGTRPPIPTH